MKLTAGTQLLLSLHLFPCARPGAAPLFAGGVYATAELSDLFGTASDHNEDVPTEDSETHGANAPGKRAHSAGRSQGFAPSLLW